MQRPNKFKAVCRYVRLTMLPLTDCFDDDADYDADGESDKIMITVL